MDHRPSDLDITLPACYTLCRRQLPISVYAAGARDATNQLHVRAAAIDRRDRQTDGRTDGHPTVTQTIPLEDGSVEKCLTVYQRSSPGGSKSRKLSIQCTDVRRILVRVSMPPCRLRRRKFDYEMVHSGVYLNKYVVSIAPFSTPAWPDCSQNIT